MPAVGAPSSYAATDIGRIADEKTVRRGRTLVMLGAADVSLVGGTITASVLDQGLKRKVTVTPSHTGRRVVFDSACTCRHPGCVHVAAALLGALDRYPELRRAAQDSLDVTPDDNLAPEARRVVFDVEPGEPPHACFVSAHLVGERTGRSRAITPVKLAMDPAAGEAARTVARAMGRSEEARTPISTALLVGVLGPLVKSGMARWLPTGRPIVAGAERTFEPTRANLPHKSGVLMGDAGSWYVDGTTGELGRVRVQEVEPPPVPKAPTTKVKRLRGAGPTLAALSSERVIVERPFTPVLRLRKLQGQDDQGRIVPINTLSLDFDYGGSLAEGDDERQFVRVIVGGTITFVRRDVAGETAANQALEADGFVQMRVSDPRSAKGRRVFVFRDREASEQWHQFLARRIPELQAQGWRAEVDTGFGPRFAKAGGLLDATIADGEPGSFSLELGIEIDGRRVPLLPILTRLLERGGVDAAQIEGDDLITSLDDGRVVRLPADRIRRLLSIMGDLIEAAAQTPDGALLLPVGEAVAVLELEDLLTTRWQDADSIQASVERFRATPDIPTTPVPAEFAASLRPYQQHGIDWLQHLRGMGLSGFLADEMGLGKTAQTIAHIAIEHAAGRLLNPALIVVPTSLITNWVAEMGKFAPHMTVQVLHGQGRHELREQLAGVHVVVTTYTVLARDIEEMRHRPWHIVVLDEAQAIKSPEAKATRAVCQLQTTHRMCLSGTPIENNLDELWSQFAFLMPGLLGDRRSFTKRFRTPIEKKSDDLRRGQLVRRIQPFILRRTKAEVAADLPPKHTILRRITLAPDQRELYETIRATVHESVREQVALVSVAQSRLIVLNALLKLRQACCDPRLVKLSSTERAIAGDTLGTGGPAKEWTSSKLDDLMDMVGEMLPEGRRILIFSQFTSMLDLIKPRLTAAGHTYVELRGDTRDRAEPVRSFEAGEVPIFLISLKAGGRGLNLTSADTVIHYDPWWNPAAEDQASDRAHRIGQTKSVFVYKLIAADTVEERIVELQQRKAELASIALSDAGGTITGFDADDIDFLFAAEQERRAA